MFDVRKEKLAVLERILETTSEMLGVVRKRNLLSNQSSQEEKEFRKKEEIYESMIVKLKNFKKELSVDEDTKNIINKLIEKLQTKLLVIKKVSTPYLKKTKEVGDLTYEIENYKEYLTSFSSMYMNLKLTADELPKDKLYELVALVLLTNETNFNISESNFFESVEMFHNLIRDSNDPVLTELLDGTSTITESILFDIFLEQIV